MKTEWESFLEHHSVTHHGFGCYTASSLACPDVIASSSDGRDNLYFNMENAYKRHFFRDGGPAEKRTWREYVERAKPTQPVAPAAETKKESNVDVVRPENKLRLAIGALCIAGLLAIAAIITCNMAHASEPCDPADRIFADGFDTVELPPWWDCWPHLSPPPPGWVCP